MLAAQFQFLRIFFLIVCGISFIYICWPTFTKFADKMTSVATRWDTADPNGRLLPTFLFCQGKIGFREGADIITLLKSKESYANKSLHVNIKFLGAALSENGVPQIKQLDHDTSTIDTVSLGTCRLFQIHRKFMAREYAQFGVNFTEGPLTMFLLNPGEDFFITSGVAKTPATPWYISGAANLMLSETIYKAEKRKQETCSDDINFEDYAKCFVKELGKRLETKVKPGCLHHIIAQYINESQLQTCPAVDPTKAFQSLSAINGYLYGKAFDDIDQVCLYPCDTSAYTLKTWPLNVDFSKDLLPGFAGEEVLYISYSSNFAIVQQEYLLFDFSDLITSAGGGLGLFLGFSFYALIDMILTWIENMIARNKVM